MQFDAIIAPTITELFESRLQGMILSGELPIGEKLPTEQQLADSMRISKSAVHAGIKSLERKGFLRVAPRHGVYVANYPETGNIETLVALLQYSGNRLNRRTVSSLLQLREGVESIAVRLLAENHTDETILALRLNIHDMKTLVHRAPPASNAALAQMIFQFHLELCLRSGNNVVPMVLNAFHDVSLAFWQGWIQYTGADAAIAFLEQFVGRIAAGDSDGAMRLYRENSDAFLTRYSDIMQP